VIIGPCTVVTGGAEPRVLEDGGVRVVGSHIAQIGSASNLAASHPDDTLWPARGRVLMPGLVNAHTHLAHHLARGLGLRSPAEWRRYEHALSPEDVFWSATAALVEGLRHGVTTACDFHRSGSAIDLSLSEILSAARKTGVRVATCYGVSEHDTPLERSAALEESLTFASDLRRRHEGRLRATVGVQAHSLAGVDALLADALERSEGSLAVHVDLALDLTPAEKWRAARRWHAGEHPALWAHADTAPRGLLALAQERGDALATVGAASTLEREAEVAWGSDSGVNAPPLPDVSNPWTLGGRPDLHYQRVFVRGARWAERHFGESLGVLAPGAPADLLMVDYRPATEFSSRTLLDHLWSGLLRAPVSGVMVSGEILMDNGTLVDVDEREVATRARECAKRVWERLG
jgi:cytosine/adenosine deaminase-related metal-dependent hydrolase